MSTNKKRKERKKNNSITEHVPLGGELALELPQQLGEVAPLSLLLGLVVEVPPGVPGL
jgi:hypothetical protein